MASFVSVTPPNETISMIDGPAADGYPIVNYEYAIVSAHQPDAIKAKDINAFLRWVITTGNQATYVNTVHFPPLAPTVSDMAEQQIGGSADGHHVLPGHEARQAVGAATSASSCCHWPGARSAAGWPPGHLLRPPAPSPRLTSD